MRCFIAIDIAEAVRESIRDVLGTLRRTSRGIKWIPVENVHITLKFLGEVKEEIVPEIEKRIAHCCSRLRPFSIEVRGSGAFPSFKRPSVLWIGMDCPEELQGLYREVEEAMAGLGFEKESRRFSPHLTLGRVKDTRDIEYTMKELATFQETFFGTIEVTEVLLMKSILKPTGAEYARVYASRLAG